MKQLLTLFFALTSLPLCALNAPPNPDHQPVLAVYSTNNVQNTRQAIRLGYGHFKRRVNTPDMTPNDIQIALLIQNGFQPFFDKLNALQDATPQQVAAAREQYAQEFSELIEKFAELLFKNQSRYASTLFLDNQTALEETVLIVQQAVEQGHF